MKNQHDKAPDKAPSRAPKAAHLPPVRDCAQTDASRHKSEKATLASTLPSSIASPLASPQSAIFAHAIDQTLARHAPPVLVLTRPDATRASQDATLVSSRSSPSDDMTLVRTGDLPANESADSFAIPASLKQIGDCMIVKKLGEGGMGVVYRAVRLMLKRTVALKVLPPQLSRANPGLVQRFLIEAQSAAKLAHPNIVTVYNVGQDGEYAFIEMEMVDGLSLEDHLENGPLSEYETRRVAVAMAKALAYAHDQGVMHRDVKPANILMTHDGQLKLSDFGLAASIHLSSSQDPATAVDSPPAPTGQSAKITRAGSVIGTLGYMSPEQLAGRHVDGRTDIFALGVTLYVLLTDQSPHMDTADSMIQLQERLYPPSDLRQTNPKVSEAFADIIHKAMANDLEYRYQNCHDMFRDLMQLTADKHTDNTNSSDNVDNADNVDNVDHSQGDPGEFWNSFSQMVRGIRPKESDSRK